MGGVVYCIVLKNYISCVSPEKITEGGIYAVCRAVVIQKTPVILECIYLCRAS